MIIFNVWIIVLQHPDSEEVVEDELPVVQHENTDKLWVVVECPVCGWSGDYPDNRRAKQALGRHAAWCKKKIKHKSGFSRPFRHKKK